MGRHLVRLVVLAAVAAAVVLSGPRLAALTADFGAGAVAVAALLFGCLCLAAAGAAWIKARSAAQEVGRLARTLDAVSRRLDAENDRNRATIAELSRTVEQPRPAGPGASQARDDETEAFQGNVVPLPVAPKRGQTLTISPQFSADDLSGQMPLTLSLEPIVDISDHAAVSFEVFAHLRSTDGAEHILRRMDRDGPALEFASGLIDAALLVARRQLREDARRLPLHVAVPSVFLADPAALGRVVETFRVNPALAETVVLSLPPDAFANRPPVKGMNALTRQGAAFAAEAWPDGEDALGQLAALGVTIVKLPAERLLRP